MLMHAIAFPIDLSAFREQESHISTSLEWHAIVWAESLIADSVAFLGYRHKAQARLRISSVPSAAL